MIIFEKEGQCEVSSRIEGGSAVGEAKDKKKSGTHGQGANQRQASRERIRRGRGNSEQMGRQRKFKFGI